MSDDFRRRHSGLQQSSRDKLLCVRREILFFENNDSDTIGSSNSNKRMS